MPLPEGREARFRRAAGLDEHDGRLRAGRDLAHQPVVRGGVPQRPAAAVKVHDDRQLLARARRPHDAHAIVPAGPTGSTLASLWTVGRPTGPACSRVRTARAATGV